MTPSEALTSAVVPALETLGTAFCGPAAEVLVLFTELQESRLQSISQIGSDMARGLPQMQRNAIDDVLTRQTSRFHAATFCDALGVEPTLDAVWGAMNENPVLASGFARLNYWNWPHALPLLGDEAATGAYYEDVWRPGALRRGDYPANYAAALAAVKGSSDGR